MALAPEQAWPILRRVRRSAKKSFHVSADAAAVGLAPEAEGVVDAFRTVGLLGMARCGVKKAVCDGCWSLLGRVHVEKDAAAVEHGARIAGGYRLANARAGHRALLASIVCVLGDGSGGRGWEVN